MLKKRPHLLRSSFPPTPFPSSSPRCRSISRPPPSSSSSSSSACKTPTSAVVVEAATPPPPPPPPPPRWRHHASFLLQATSDATQIALSRVFITRGKMSFVFRGTRGDIETGFPGYIPERRAVRLHAGGRHSNSNSMMFLITVLLLFMVLNSQQISPNFLVWLVLGVFLMATSLRMYATCQQLQAQAQAQAHAAAASGLLGHTELRLHMLPSLAFTRGRLQGLRLQLALLDHEFDDLDYDTLRALDADNGPGVPSMSEEEINALPVHKYKMQSRDISSASQSDGSSMQQASSSILNEKKVDLTPEVIERNPEDGLTCSVCLEQVNIGEVIRSLPCLHQFHASCIDPWLRQQGTCPICKHRADSGWQRSEEGDVDASYLV